MAASLCTGALHVAAGLLRFMLVQAGHASCTVRASPISPGPSCSALTFIGAGGACSVTAAPTCTEPSQRWTAAATGAHEHRSQGLWRGWTPLRKCGWHAAAVHAGTVYNSRCIVSMLQCKTTAGEPISCGLATAGDGRCHPRWLTVGRRALACSERGRSFLQACTTPRF